MTESHYGPRSLGLLVGSLHLPVLQLPVILHGYLHYLSLRSLREPLNADEENTENAGPVWAEHVRLQVSQQRLGFLFSIPQSLVL